MTAGADPAAGSPAGALAGSTAVVTGGGWNIGRAVALRFAREGARVVVAGRTRERLDETIAAIQAEGGTGLAVPTDVLDLASVEALERTTRDAFGPVDILACIAGGGGGYEPLDEIDPAWWAHVVNLNLVGTFHTVRAFLPGMRALPRASILTCTGGGGWFPLVGIHATAYATAKAGIGRLTDQLAVELMETGIRVNCLQPGLTWDEGRRAAVEAEEARTGQPHPDREVNHDPDDAAELAVFLAGEASAPLTGRSVSVDEDWWRDRATLEAVCASHHAYTLRRVELER